MHLACSPPVVRMDCSYCINNDGYYAPLPAPQVFLGRRSHG